MAPTQDDIITQLKAEVKDWQSSYEAMRIERDTLWKKVQSLKAQVSQMSESTMKVLVRQLQEDIRKYKDAEKGYKAIIDSLTEDNRKLKAKK